jgi:hypothetical protein
MAGFDAEDRAERCDSGEDEPGDNCAGLRRSRDEQTASARREAGRAAALKGIADGLLSGGGSKTTTCTSQISGSSIFTTCN